jgi:hypothetical protein
MPGNGIDHHLTMDQRQALSRSENMGHQPHELNIEQPQMH